MQRNRLGVWRGGGHGGGRGGGGKGCRCMCLSLIIAIASSMSYSSRLRNNTSQLLHPFPTLVSPPCVTSQPVPPSFLPAFGMKNNCRPLTQTSTYLCKYGQGRRWKYQLHRHQKRRANYSARDMRRTREALQRLAAQRASLQEWQQACSHLQRNCPTCRLLMYAHGGKRRRVHRDAAGGG